MTSLVTFCSPKGGTGKTSLAANIAGALARTGLRVLAIDLDVQNTLRLPFGVPFADRRGHARCLIDGRPIREGIVQSGSHLLVLPFGQVSTAEYRAVAAHVTGNGEWLREMVAPFLAQEFVVVIDTPTGPTVFLDQTRTVSTLDIVTFQADAASLALLPRVEAGDFTGGSRPGRPGVARYLFNQIDHRRRLVRESVAQLEQRLGERLLGLVNLDDTFSDAVAHQQLVIDHSPTSKASRDIRGIAAAVTVLLAAGEDGHEVRHAS
jgi:cellulose synthase operon protein YhjQ